MAAEVKQQNDNYDENYDENYKAAIILSLMQGQIDKAEADFLISSNYIPRNENLGLIKFLHRHFDAQGHFQFFNPAIHFSSRVILFLICFSVLPLLGLLVITALVELKRLQIS